MIKSKKLPDYPLWIDYVLQEMGQKEIPGSKDNPKILEYFKSTTYKATHDEVPWCAAFVNWVLKQAGITGSKSAAAVSFLNWGRDCEDEPENGCIVVFEWDNGGHHVAFYKDGGDDYVECWGGNQGNQVKVSRFPLDAVMSYRWPVGDRWKI